MNSGAGLRANPTWSAYAASKFGLRAFADALRQEETDHGVRVTSVFPGRTATPMQEKVHGQEGKEYDAADWIEPATVAAAIVHVLDLPRDATIPDLTVSPGRGLTRLLRASWVSSTRPRASSSGGTYIPKRPR